MLPFDSLVLNKYRIRRSPGRRDGLLGKGTFGNVYLAHEELADRDVAIKELGLDSADLDADIARLQGLGAELLDGPMDAGRGVRIAFLKAPDDVRIELIEQPRVS